MGIVVLSKGVEAPWAIGRVVRFIDSLGYREITWKERHGASHRRFQEPKTLKGYGAEVTTEETVKGDQQTKGLIENAVSDVTLKVPSKNRHESVTGNHTCKETTCLRPSAAMAGGTHSKRSVQVSERVRRTDTVGTIAWQAITSTIRLVRREGAGKPNIN